MDRDMDRDIWAKIKTLIDGANRRAFEAGRLLHGQRECYDWSKAVFYREAIQRLGVKKTTIVNYIKLYENLSPYGARIEDILEYIPQSILYDLLSPKVPKDVQEFILTNINRKYPASKAKTLKLIKRLGEGELAIDSPEIKALVIDNVVEQEKAILEQKISKPLRKALEDSKEKLSKFSGTNRKKLTSSIERMAHIWNRAEKRFRQAEEESLQENSEKGQREKAA